MFSCMYLGIFLLLWNKVSAADDGDCPELFQRYSKKHSYCRPANESCEILAYYPTQKEINQIVKLHNQYRNIIAKGEENLPPASNMLEMEWDNELAAVAQKYADQCIYQHDCSNCRRVMNFGVGQNVAIQRLVGGHIVPQPDWGFAVSDWFSELKYFPTNDVNSFQPPEDGKEYRHFAQLIWAESFRVGCGYVLFKEGDIFTDETFVRLYFCNYGPTGNIVGSKVYEEGRACKNCPGNTCCGNSCKYGNKYQGLCKRTSKDAPIYPIPPGAIFDCNFRRNQKDCANYIDGNPNWLIEPTLSGNYLGITLNGGENSTITFERTIKPKQSLDKFCITLKYRKGPNIDGQEVANTALEMYYIAERDTIVTQELKGYDNPARQQFSTYNMTLDWNYETQLKLSFAVPSGKPPQFFNIDSIVATNGECQG